MLADLQVWRESGAAASHREHEGGTDFTDPVVIASEARYDALRVEPRFAVLMSRLADEPRRMAAQP